MTRETVGVGAVAVAGLWLGASPVRLAAQELAERVRAAPDGWVRMAYEVREGVCGDGASIRTVARGEAPPREDSRCPCEEGPARVELRVRGGVVEELTLRVGGGWAERPPPVTDLGTVAAAEAAAYLLALAPRAGGSMGKRAVFAATLARDVEAWPDLLRLARDDSVPRETRRAAVFWVGQAAAEAATAGLESLVESQAELEVREHAVFALSQQRSEGAVEALMRIARTSPEPRLRKRALFWLGQRADDPRVLSLFEEILAGR